ncbi:hypothetical protein ANN_15172 [Periplaneta americana]|uniref:Uncharacterized protein n=1 Tax=Periplaneta americana TaxID=6978 RepID=A0ABQ8SHH4_PERAM|nr:hypothetical protein ANN_15172 [Periplaneta americana]
MVEFAATMLQRIDDESEFLKYILFSDEATFHAPYRHCSVEASLYAVLSTQSLPSKERIPNLTGEQSDGITVFRIPPMTSLMLHRCRTGAINLQRPAASQAGVASKFAILLQSTTTLTLQLLLLLLLLLHTITTTITTINTTTSSHQ